LGVGEASLGVLEHARTQRAATSHRSLHLRGLYTATRAAAIAAAAPVRVEGRAYVDLERSLARAATLAGLSGITPHTLRHTAATWLMQNGVPIWEAAGLLAMSPEMLDRIYGHHHPDHLRNAARKIGSKA
jgi:site-specific recombinase XerC